jgi:hypothetical protein
MDRRHPHIRRLLRLLRHPIRLEEDDLALSLRDALACDTACEAVLTVVQRALPGPTEINQLMRASVLSQDHDGNKARRVATSLGLSLRSYFRYRSTAIDLIALAVERELRPPQTVDTSAQLTQHWRKKMREALRMKPSCERCKGDLSPSAAAFICSYECTFCPGCAHESHHICPNCGGELRARPRRREALSA